MIATRKKTDRAAFRLGTAARWIATSALLSLAGCSSPEAGAVASGQPSTSSTRASSDCSRIAATKDRQACLLALPEADCKLLGATCISLRETRSINEKLTRIEREILDKARVRYASYATDDPAYLDDLEKNFNAASKAWRTYRDAYCQAEPLVQGMSRNEQDALTADCSINATRLRIEQLEQLIKAIP
ncbi:lysozyme inhibitor LprI family protein [Xanthomonas hortorum]|uniref:lysozyme inhibitor LprI family protein n=1 Tax=Xanthomonas hortorum TaxID=56454 RepID=UPI002935D7F0|nr:lysozyme inhibitor LprI family protein [Xanthomonas hortorum]MDV2453088.1 lysozyme inhibitor LprI family protein [Xanthomonas hortorum NBC5720]